MKLLIKLISTVLLLAMSITALAYFFWYKTKFVPKKNKASFTIPKKEIDKTVAARLHLKSAGITDYIRKHHYNSTYCFMIDMKMESGKKRFFVYNLDKDSIELAGLVAHGSGDDHSTEIKFSNQPGSLCSSLGKYKICKSYFGKFGLAYKLYGLDKTNSNALNRFVVLHSHSCVPADETSPFPICESWGCPTVAPTFLNELKKYINRSDKPILLNMYY
ncbi:murein L,D-transpeptidase catalytic domain family protein [Ferruginibacter lapsinanis]|uniref:murein L,D-transpeptidase catalytic domain-containing protein n=1 Tax=Ferruginibacter lapsinanis TaxID=563172 RepID=UPI001E4DEF48|nr:murein L,D-transpeptidase catalytic domain family protein [Ferruginibacter lapsinanis]UEG50413.1 murein L,D-transpeptidase catalytic domain family protein [Ferruginibacter lapsinanis]